MGFNSGFKGLRYFAFCPHSMFGVFCETVTRTAIIFIDQTEWTSKWQQFVLVEAKTGCLFIIKSAFSLKGLTF